MDQWARADNLRDGRDGFITAQKVRCVNDTVGISQQMSSQRLPSCFGISGPGPDLGLELRGLVPSTLSREKDAGFYRLRLAAL